MKLQFFLNFLQNCYKKFYNIKIPYKNGKEEEKMDLLKEVGLVKRKSCSEIYATKEVLSQQLLNELVQEKELLKGVSNQDKIKFHQKLNALLFSQFDSLVDRVNKL